MKVKDETELRKLGYAIDPASPEKAMPISELTNSTPDETWDERRLGLYASSCLAEADRQARNHHIHRDARLGPRRSAAMTFGIG